MGLFQGLFQGAPQLSDISPERQVIPMICTYPCLLRSKKYHSWINLCEKIKILLLLKIALFKNSDDKI